MTDAERDAILALALHAAFADGAKDARERDELRRIADGLSSQGAPNLSALYQDVLLGRRTVEQAATELRSPELRQLAYEMAVCVADADGAQSEAERALLARAARALGLPPEEAEAVSAQAEALATFPLAEGSAPPDATPPLQAGPVRPLAAAAAQPEPMTAAGPAAAPRAAAPDEAALDRSILNASILNGALELLPQSMSTLAIIPLQMRLVYTVGKTYGYELDRGHVKDLLATLGVGLTSQYVEDVGRKLLGGLLRKAGGGLLGGLGRAATGSAFSFASTYALGQVAKRYYGGGRQLSADLLRQTYQDVLGDGRQLRERWAPQIEQRARTLDVAQILQSVRGGVGSRLF